MNFVSEKTRASLTSSLRLNLARVAPNALGQVPYSVALRGLQKSADRLGARLWARGSYVLGYFTPFLSDLDLTLWLEAEPTREAWARFILDFRRIRRWMPTLGELNVYEPSTKKPALGLISPLELKRDPELSLFACRMTPHPRSLAVTRAEGAAFLLRMLESDYANLARHPAARLPKWRHHIASLPREWGEVADPSTLQADTLLDELVRRVAILAGEGEDGAIRGEGEQSHALLQNAIFTHFLRVRLKRPLHECALDSKLVALFPHRYCFQEHCSVPDGAHLEVMRSQIRWEAWGLLTQHRFIPQDEGWRRHRENLQRLAQRAGILDAFEIDP